MTTSEQAATIAAIKLSATQRLRTLQDALTLLQSPLGRPNDQTDINQLLAERSALIYDVVHGKILTASEAASALLLSRQRVYVLLEEQRAARSRALEGAQTPAHTQLPEADV